MAISTERYSALHTRLTEERDRLTQEVGGLRQEVLDYTEDLRDEDRSYGNHMADDATNTFEQERQAALQRNLESVLNEVNDALARMDAGTYGTCVDCGKEIPIERLEARPYAIRCIEDQEREDRLGKQ
jgi:RNA polymerase-binding protein DksA